MQRRLFIFTASLVLVMTTVFASPVAAQELCLDALKNAPLGSTCTQTGDQVTVTPGDGFINPGAPDPSGSGGFAALFVIALLASAGIAIWKFTAIRDMGMRRGMNRRDASTAAIFSDDAVMLGMVLKDEPRRDEPPPAQRSTADMSAAKNPSKTIEDRLGQLEKLRISGSISDAEAADRRAEILDEI